MRVRTRWTRFSVMLAAVATIAIGACSKDPQVVAHERVASGDAYLAKEQYKEAIIEYRAAVQAAPQSGRARKKLAEAYVKTNDVRGASGETIRAADLLPDDTDLQIKAGEMLLLAGRFEDAKTRVDAVLARDPKHARAMIVRANALAGLKELGAAISDLEEAIRLDPTRSESYTNLGLFQLAKGKREEAEKTFKQAVDTDPRSVPARLALGNFYFATGKQQSGEAELRGALEIDPENLLANRALALFAIASGKPQDAEAYIKRMADVSKTSAGQLTLADYYAAMRRYADATRILKVLTANRDASMTANVRLAGIELVQGQLAQAHRYVDEALRTDPKDAPALLMRGRVLLTENKREDAVTSLKGAIATNPNELGAHFVLGQAYLALQDWGEATKSFQEVLRLNPRALAADLHLSQVKLASGEAEAAVQHAQQVLDKVPGSADARALLVRGLIVKGDLSRADKELKPLVDGYAGSPTTHALVARLQFMKKDVAGARRSYERALTLDPKNLEALEGVVGIAFASGRPAEAKTLVEKALGQNQPGPAALHMLAARAYMAMDEAANAERAARKALEIDPSTMSAYGMLGSLYVRQQRLDAARAEFEQITQKQPRSVAAHTVIGMILEMQQKKTDAERAYQKALDVDPRAAVAANNLAWMYVDSDRNLDIALDLALAAQRQLPDEPNVNDTVGWIYYKKNRFDHAVKALSNSVAKDPSRADFQFHLGMAYVRFGDADKGRRHLKRALQLQPAFAGSGEAQKTLASIGG